MKVWFDHVSYCHHLSSVCKLFQKSSSLKPLNQFRPNLATITLRVSSLKIVSDVPADQRLPLLKVEHRGKINKKNQWKNPEKLCESAIASKSRWNDTFVIPYKKYGWWPEPPSNMAASVIKKRKFDKKFWKILERANCFQTSRKWYICDYLSELWLISLATIKHDWHHCWK